MAIAKGSKIDDGQQRGTGAKVGRPKTRHEKLQPISTRCPAPVLIYLKGITPFRYPSMTAMFADMLARFSAEKPWQHGLLWRKPKTAVSLAGKKVGATGWEQLNISLIPEQAEEVAAMADKCGVSKACYCYTAIFWWVTYVFPPASVR